MNPPSPFTTTKHLILDTFRQAWASGISWMMLAGTAICVLLCLSVSVSDDVRLRGDGEPGFFLPSSSENNPEHARREGVETVRGRMTLAFGAVAFPLTRERSDAVHFLELVLAGGVAGTLGLLLALAWTAGFMPAFLDPRAAAVLLAKPIARWQLLLGKYFGVLTFLGFHLALFVVLTWFALGVRTNVWDVTYWWAVPLLLLQLAIFYSFSVLLAVLTRNTAVCVVGAVLFWLLSWGINYGSVVARNLTSHQEMPGVTRALAQAGYWISPKPIDAELILFDALNAQEHFQKPELFRLLESGPNFSPLLSILSCLLITGVLLALSAHELNAMDY